MQKIRTKCCRLAHKMSCMPTTDVAGGVDEGGASGSRGRSTSTTRTARSARTPSGSSVGGLAASTSSASRHIGKRASRASSESEQDDSEDTDLSFQEILADSQLEGAPEATQPTQVFQRRRRKDRTGIGSTNVVSKPQRPRCQNLPFSPNQ